MFKVLVLLSTYNGEKFIEEQILSILKQKNVEVILLIRDDGSKDKTINIIKGHFVSFENVYLIEGKNVGFVGSFSELILAARKFNNVDYFAFADQDDIWHSNKLLTACMALREFPEEEPNLFSSNSNIVDSHGEFKKVLRDYDIRYRYGNVLYGACLQGCSMVFNKKAVELFSKHIPHFTYHDVWMLYICVYFGNFIYWRSPLFDYRIHSSNAIGLATIKKNSFWSRIKNVFFTERDEKKVESAIEFQREFEKSFTDCQKK